jgi:hypothetical protein
MATFPFFLGFGDPLVSLLGLVNMSVSVGCSWGNSQRGKEREREQMASREGGVRGLGGFKASGDLGLG